MDTFDELDITTLGLGDWLDPNAEKHRMLYEQIVHRIDHQSGRRSRVYGRSGDTLVTAQKPILRMTNRGKRRITNITSPQIGGA